MRKGPLLTLTFFGGLSVTRRCTVTPDAFAGHGILSTMVNDQESHDVILHTSWHGHVCQWLNSAQGSASRRARRFPPSCRVGPSEQSTLGRLAAKWANSI